MEPFASVLHAVRRHNGTRLDVGDTFPSTPVSPQPMYPSQHSLYPGWLTFKSQSAGWQNLGKLTEPCREVH